MYLPTSCLLLLEALHDARPSHCLLLADFDCLPETQIPGRNAPLVASTVRRQGRGEREGGRERERVGEREKRGVGEGRRGNGEGEREGEEGRAGERAGEQL